MRKLGRTLEKMLDLFSIVLLLREVMYYDQWLRSVLVFINGRELLVDFMILAMHDYEVILGIDWLSKYNITIDCKKKMMIH